MTQLWIDGAATEAGGDARPVQDPATLEEIATVRDATPEDVDRAVRAAQGAFPAWAATDVQKRAGIVRKAADLLQEHADELVASLVREQGKPTLEAKGEFSHFVNGLRFYSELGSKVRGGYQELPSQFGRSYGLTIRRPLGVVAGIIPWNFPLTLLANKLAPALVAGNTMVAKPAETTPLTTLRVAELLTEAGVPDGVVNVVTGAAETGEALVTHPLVRRVAFTGQTSTGQRIAELAGRDLKKVSLELGGSDPTIVLADADLDAAVKTIQIGRYWNCGQMCLAPKRAFVVSELYDQFVDSLVSRVERYEPGKGDEPAEKPKLRIGPLHTARQLEVLQEQVADAVDRGAKVLTGGDVPQDTPGGHFFQPAVVVDVPRDARLATEEVFGPVLPIWRVDDVDQAIEYANDTSYGLGSSIWTRDAGAIDKAMNGLETGITWVNQMHYGYDEMPFGGTKMSGIGREHGAEALEEYVEIKSVVVGGLH
ncbi:aldehyde dehydrogenase [Egicoccus sp. AB-alg2]|uniref:aldehyde dehydrogenase family protein n=1 Tax=Egicoccus sp. AB-alg2 TaxID=3242693 RepID=UPI00359CC3A9